MTKYVVGAIGGKNKKRKRLRKSNFEDVEAVLVRFLKFAIVENFPCSDTILLEKAIKLAKEMKVDYLNASSGWIRHLKKWHNLSFRTVSGEAAAVNNDAI